MPVNDAKNPAQTFQTAVALHAQGRLAEAGRLYAIVLKASPNHFDTLFRLGLVHLQQGRFDDAIRLLRRALNQKPQSADAQLALGNAFRAVNRFDEAIDRYQRALAIKKDFAEAHNNIGSVMTLRRRHGEAIPYYEKAVALKPDYAEAYNNLGTAYTALTRIEDAKARYEKAIALRPDYAEALSNLGAALRVLKRPEEAITHYRRAIAAKPTLVDAHGNLANTLKELGRIDEAAQALERAIALAPRRAQYYHSLTDCKRFAEGDAELVALEALARDTSALPVDERVHLHFALGKIYGDLGQKERSFLQLLEANRLRRGIMVYDEAETLDEIDRLTEAPAADFVTDRSEVGDASPLPVFILGMPRSGTSLVEQILASHPQVFGAGELTTLEETVAKLSKKADGRAPSRAELSALGADQLRHLGADYLGAIRGLSPGAARITDKMPANFRFTGLIHLALPNARIIHTRRDPIDTCLSCFSQLFGSGLPFTYDLAELGRFYHAYETAMEHWRRVLPAGAMLEVQYEEVVADLEGQARRIIDYCGLAWDNACLEFYKTERPVRTASVAQVRQPIYSTSVGRWRPYARHLEPLYAALGRSAPP